MLIVIYSLLLLWDNNNVLSYAVEMPFQATGCKDTSDNYFQGIFEFLIITTKDFYYGGWILWPIPSLASLSLVIFN